MKVAVVGLGRVGSRIAFCLMENKNIDEILLINRTMETAEGIYLELSSAFPEIAKKIKVSYFEDAEKIVIVDAIRAEGPPGEIYKFTPKDFDTDHTLKASLHDITLDEVFKIAGKLGMLPPITIFGVQPKDITWGMELSQEIGKILPRLAQLVKEEIKNA